MVYPEARKMGQPQQAHFFDGRNRNPRAGGREVRTVDKHELQLVSDVEWSGQD